MVWEDYADRFWAKVEKTDTCWWWRGATRAKPNGKPGYGAVLWGGKKYSTHRISYEMAYGPIPVGLCVCHRCDNPLCVRPDHFFLGTHRENAEDRTRKGRQARGDTNGYAKLTSANVVQMRAMYARGDGTMREIGARFGVDRATAHQAIVGDRWKDVPTLSAEQLRTAAHANRSRHSTAINTRRWARARG